MDIWEKIEAEEAAYDEMTPFDEEDAAMESKEEPQHRVIGKCPKCGADVYYGKYGAYCSDRCGMWLNRAMGAMLSFEDAKKVLAGEKIFLRHLKNRAGKEYDAYLTPLEVVEFSYTDEDGEEVNGYQYKYEMKFPKRRKKGYER